MPQNEPATPEGSLRAPTARTVTVVLAFDDRELEKRVLAGLDGDKFVVRRCDAAFPAEARPEVLITDQSLAAEPLACFHDRLILGDVGVLLIGRSLTADVLLPSDFTRRELRLATRMLAQVVSLRRQNRRLQQLASTDALTQLPNRRAVEERFSEGIASQTAMALALIDMDGFKAVNSKLGYVQGDEILRGVGKLLAARCAPHFAGRLGGDEFVLLLSIADEDAAFALTDTLRHDVSLAASMKAARPISASAGVAIATAPVAFTELLAAADAALRRAKQAGGKQTERASTGLA